MNGEKTKRGFPYLLSDPIDFVRQFPVLKIVVICRHDQLWSEYPDKYGSYRDAKKYFDTILRNSNGSVRRFQLERHSVRGFKYLIQPEDRLGVIPKAITPGWVNVIEDVRIEIFWTSLLNGKRRQDKTQRENNSRKERMNILARIMNPRNQTLSWADILKGTEQELPNADYEKNM
jgi:hypothetical protein